MTAATVATDGSGELTPIDRYLAEQADLTAVERFRQRHASAAMPAGARYYRDLIPLRQPAPGQQYGFEVDLDACTGCKACVTACHALNGLDEGESWRTVGLVHGGSQAHPRQQTVTASCHHCVDPACLTGCPVKAYEKDPVTGIVAHLDDQCIGCRYCQLTCPYEVPRYNPGRGIVRKCDLCAGRLAEGEAPACVQSCPNSAIRVTLVDTAAAIVAAGEGPLVEGAPPSTITVPTTSYRSARPAGGASARPAPPVPAPSHPPLAAMLVLTQLAVGASVVDVVARALWPAAMVDDVRPTTAVVTVAVGLLALAASVFHLGRPAYAFRAVLGIRRSWLSREIVAFVAFAGLAMASGWVMLVDSGGSWGTVLGTVAAVAGVAGVACSALVYAVTGRAWWALARTTVKFALSAVSMGAATVLITSLVLALSVGGTTVAWATGGLAPTLALVAAGTAAAKLAAEATVLRHLAAGAAGGPSPEHPAVGRPRADGGITPSAGSAELRRSALLLTGPLSVSTRWRFATGGAAVVLLAATARASATSAGTALALGAPGLAVLVAGELIERWQFFTAAAPPRMPGGAG